MIGQLIIRTTTKRPLSTHIKIILKKGFLDYCHPTIKMTSNIPRFTLPRILYTLLYLEYKIWSTSWTTSALPEFTPDNHKEIFIWATMLTGTFLNCVLAFYFLDFMRITLLDVILDTICSAHRIRFLCIIVLGLVPGFLICHTAWYQYTV